MPRDSRTTIGTILLLALAVNGRAAAQPPQIPISFVVEAGRPVRLALDQRERVKRVGQPITATLIEPVYAYDRVVIPAGTKASGHIDRIERVTKDRRVRSLLAGDLTPSRRVMVKFDTLTLPDGRAIPIRTAEALGAERVVLRVADPPRREAAVSRARQEAARQIKQAVAVATAPGKLDRLRDFAIGSLPYRPQFLRKGTVYVATLASPLEFARDLPIERAPQGIAPAADTILNARLMTAVSSRNTPRGTPIEAVLTQPVFSADHRLILPEGSRLHGQVTLARNARRFHRNGQLRFLFERVGAPEGGSAKLLASLYSVESDGGERLVIDEEGGTMMTNSKARFAAPAIGALALVGALHNSVEYDTDSLGPEVQHGGPGAAAVGGWLGLAGIGAVVSAVSRPATLTLTVVGLARTTYSSVFGRGRDVSFPAETPIQVQLAPGSNSKQE